MPKPESRIYRFIEGSMDTPSLGMDEIRDYFVFKSIDGGYILARVSKVAGHADPSITAKHYAKAVAEREQAADEGDGMVAIIGGSVCYPMFLLTMRWATPTKGRKGQ